MCIRDRGSAAGGAAAALDGMEQRRLPPGGLPPGRHRHRVRRPAGAGPGAVSYTHLRAHETVLDLVCRLLLEKKKENMSVHT